ncbi:hypothetical protein JOF29_003611 [Kribbella aluminosa]|uniref:Uncharacterized protein n=1 Tax=Kribbella aluminosa TaxID=416017 RepID=A0ABS4ULK8_9ACTN|nr:hypothetical protein [Kribbella aluminosa]MBP2352528.1 hypothetical protein [Kribbella aluminosa]
MKDPLSRVIVWSLTLFAVLATGAAALATTQAWASRHRPDSPPPVSKAEVVSVQRYAGAPPVILVVGPTGSDVEVGGTQDLNQPYPLEGDYMDVVFLGSGAAVVPAAGRHDHTGSSTILMVGIWLGWCVVIGGCLLAGRYLRDAGRPWWPQRPALRSARAQGAVTKLHQREDRAGIPRARR